MARGARGTQGRRPRRCANTVARTPEDDLEMVLYKASGAINQLYQKLPCANGALLDPADLVKDLSTGCTAFGNMPSVKLGAGGQAEVFKVEMPDGSFVACKKYTIDQAALGQIHDSICCGGLLEVAVAWLGGKGLTIPGVQQYCGADIKLNPDTKAIDVRIFSELAHMDAGKFTHGFLHSSNAMLRNAEQQLLLATAAPGSRAVDVLTIYYLLAKPLEGLAQLHALGAVNGDVKLSNFLVLVTAAAKIIQSHLSDLGGGDFLDLVPGSTVCSKRLFGTREYMSHARITAGNGSVSVYDDVFAWGKSLLEALTGGLPGAHLDAWANCGALLEWVTTPMDSYLALPPQHQPKGLALMIIKQQGLAGQLYIELFRLAGVAMTGKFTAEQMIRIMGQCVGKLVADLQAPGANPYVVLPGDLMPCWADEVMSRAAAVAPDAVASPAVPPAAVPPAAVPPAAVPPAAVPPAAAAPFKAEPDQAVQDSEEDTAAARDGDVIASVAVTAHMLAGIAEEPSSAITQELLLADSCVTSLTQEACIASSTASTISTATSSKPARRQSLWSWLAKPWSGKGSQQQSSSSSKVTGSEKPSCEAVHQAWDMRWFGGC